jgi:hypothetical protein
MKEILLKLIADALENLRANNKYGTQEYYDLILMREKLS